MEDFNDDFYCIGFDNEERGKYFYEKGDLKQAKHYFKEDIRNTTDYTGSLPELINIYEEQGKFRHASRYARKLMLRKYFNNFYDIIYKKLLEFNNKITKFGKVKNTLVYLNYLKENEKYLKNPFFDGKGTFRQEITASNQIQEEVVNLLSNNFDNKVPSNIINLTQQRNYLGALEEFRKFEKQEKQQTNHR